MSKLLTPQDILDAAIALDCDPAAVKAVDEVESKGAGFLSDGRPKILFEAHVFARLTDQRYTRTHPNVSSRRWNRALYARTGAGEHQRLAQASTLDRDAALQAASWGRFQIMGFNFRACGFSTLQGFINAMYASEGRQLDAFVAYVKTRKLDDELREHRWAAFALGYNGPLYAENHYDTKLAAAHKRHSR